MWNSPSLTLQSLKRFRFKKHSPNEEGNSNEDENSTTNNSESIANEYSTDEGGSRTTYDSNTNDESELICQRKTGRLLSNDSVDSDSEVVTVKKKRMFVDSYSDNDGTSDNESVIRKKKRFKLSSSDEDETNSISNSNSCDMFNKNCKSSYSKIKTKAKSTDNVPGISSATSGNYVSNDYLSSSDDNEAVKNSKTVENEMPANDCLSESDKNSKEFKSSVLVKDELSESDVEFADTSIGDKNNEEPSSNSKKQKSKKKKKKGDVTIEESVYNSDADSDEEISNKMSGIKLRVFEFLNTAPEEELKELKCTAKKIKSVITARPFKGWRHLVLTCEGNRSTDVLNATQDLLTARDVLTSLMSQCELISKRTEMAIEKGASDIVKQPLLLNPSMELKSYQMVGLNWLAVIHQQKISGILADEMGLGKTIQIIAFLAYLKEKGFTKEDMPHLIVVPSSTLDNWCNEFQKWCPSLNIVQYYGSQDERRLMRNDWIRSGCKDIDVILSTYQIISGIYEDKKLFRIINSHYAIFDEGHMLKNMNTQRYGNLDRVNAKRKLLLTGTPIQNNLLELMSLLMFIMPKMFANKKDFIKYLFDKKSKQVEEQVKFDLENVENAKRIMRPFMLRRLKADVLQDLPTKTTVIMECPMVKSQANKYKDLLDQFKNSSEDPDLKGKSHMGMFTELRKMANHPLTLRYLFSEEILNKMAKLLSTDYNYKENDVEKIFEDLYFMSDHELHQLTKIYKCLKSFSLPDEVFLESGKFAKLDELLPDLKAKKHRLLIFSQFIFLLDLLESYMTIRGHSFLRFDGSTRVSERQQLIDIYNQDDQIFVFLLTTKAGGVGINLTAADTVIIHDVDFNPYNDKQAEDRCHRMGQTRDVKIIRFISKDTIEEHIFKVAQKKSTLGKEVTTINDEAEEQKDMASLLHMALGIKEVS